MIKSQPINIIRYKNGTLIKLTPSAEGFMSYDYNVISGAATYAPEQIDIVAKAEGDLTVDKWEYSYDGETWYEVINGEDGIAINDNVLSIIPSSPLFSDTQSTVTFKCTGSDGEHYDTVMITRHVDPLYIYRTTNANIEQTNSKIRLIASDEQLNQFTVGKTMMSKVAEIEQTANGIKSTVETKYATKVYADASAGTAESNAKNYAKTYADSSAGAAETNAKAYADSTSEAAEQNAKDYADSSANTAESNAKSYAKSYADTASGAAEQNAKQYAATSASNAESRAKAYADTKETTLRSEISQTASGIRSEVVMKDGFEDSVGSVVEQKADSIRLKASNIVWESQKSSMAEDGTFSCQNAIIGGTIEVGKSQNVAGTIKIYNSNNANTANINANGMVFEQNGIAQFKGSGTTPAGVKVTDTITEITDGIINFKADNAIVGKMGIAASAKNNYGVGFGLYNNSGFSVIDQTKQKTFFSVYSEAKKSAKGVKYNVAVHYPMKTSTLISVPHLYTDWRWGLAVSPASSYSGSICRVTVFGPWVHVYVKAKLSTVNMDFYVQSNTDYSMVLSNLPKPAYLASSYNMRFPELRVPCQMSIDTLGLALFNYYNQDCRLHIVSRYLSSGHSYTLNETISAEFTYTFDPSLDLFSSTPSSSEILS